MTRPPRVPRARYNQRLSGVYGEFGSGAGSRAFYLQSAMSPRDLDRISLVSDIPGSEKWPVRALFQREIDKRRVDDGLLPYLRNTHQVRFFNPLTLTLLPMDLQGRAVLPTMPRPTEGTMDFEGDSWMTLERKDFYRLRWIPNALEYAVLDWNDTRSRLVAIDGQHRLFGLKRLWGDTTEVPPGEDFLTWRIPVVVVSFRDDERSNSVPTVLETVRRIFVSINTHAQTVSDARSILLSDDSINALCTQELIETAHSNDSKPIEHRDPERIPLIFFDWRGEERRGEAVRSPAAIKAIVEIRDWFNYYFLGRDFSEKQYNVMGVTPTSNLHSAFQNKGLTHDQGEQVRDWARSDLLLALGHLLENFTPYRRYIAALRGIEREARDPARDALRHALEELRFGSHRAEESITDDVREELGRIKKSIEHAKREHLDKLLQEDIGLRGIACAFGDLRSRFYGPPDWFDYATRFTDSLNLVRDDGWLSLEPKAKHRGILLHIAEDYGETVVNYRLESARNALGALTSLLVAAYGAPWPDIWKFHWDALREARLEILEGTLRRGYRRQFKIELREQYPDDGTLAREVNKKAEQATRRRLSKLRTAVNKVVDNRRPS